MGPKGNQPIQPTQRPPLKLNAYAGFGLYFLLFPQDFPTSSYFPDKFKKVGPYYADCHEIQGI